jgi:hypothetical protein
LGIEDLIKESPITDIDWTGDGVYDGTDTPDFSTQQYPKAKMKNSRLKNSTVKTTLRGTPLKDSLTFIS